MTRTDTSFLSDGVRCGAWHYSSETDALTTLAGRPCVVMAHGFGGTRDSGLEPFAEAFAAAGADVVLFDYRYFGTSEGEPRQFIHLAGQVADYHAAIAHARSLDGVDPDRIAVWGVSMSGGHVFAVAADDHRIAAAMSLTPAVDGVAATTAIVKRDGILSALKAMPAALRDLVAARCGRAPVYLPLAGTPGDIAALTAPGAYHAYVELGGPTWRNEFTARTFLEVGRHRPGRRAGEVACPMLVQIGDLDQSAPPLAAVDAARNLKRAEVRHYPCDHFDVHVGGDWHERAIEHQVEFLVRHLARTAET